MLYTVGMFSSLTTFAFLNLHVSYNCTHRQLTPLCDPLPTISNSPVVDSDVCLSFLARYLVELSYYTIHNYITDLE